MRPELKAFYAKFETIEASWRKLDAEARERRKRDHRERLRELCAEVHVKFLNAASQANFELDRRGKVSPATYGKVARAWRWFVKLSAAELRIRS
jgi:hypothetical protein